MAFINSDLKTYLSRETGENSGLSLKTIGGKLSSLYNVSNIDYQRVPTAESTSCASSENNEWLPTLSKKHRIIGFFVCIILGVICFSLATLYIPLLLLKARKFALLYTLGSLFLVCSFSFLWGPVSHLKHLFSWGQIPFTLPYFATLLCTLYFAMVLKSTLLTAVFAIIQMITLFWYLTSRIPGGQTGFKFFAKIFTTAFSKTVTRTLPV